MLVILLPAFKPDELRQALMPTLEKLYKQDPESLPFRQPVDPQLLQIPVSKILFKVFLYFVELFFVKVVI